MTADHRYYQHVANKILQQLRSGCYSVGDRLPAERDLAVEYDSSRSIVREALISLEVQGFVDVRVGSGTFVRRLPNVDSLPQASEHIYELTQARMMIEGEAAALAATCITSQEVNQLEDLVALTSIEGVRSKATEVADRDFHLGIASATRNIIVKKMVADLWNSRLVSQGFSYLDLHNSDSNHYTLDFEHRTILDSLKLRDSAKARTAMRNHLLQSMLRLLDFHERSEMDEARRSTAAIKQRYDDLKKVI
ncbi:FadR/GntR family transcriptional regulator [Sphingomonas sp. M6A6_1c]